MGSMPKLSIVKGVQEKLTPCSLQRIFEQTQQQHADKTALIFEDQHTNNKTEMSYTELNCNANRCARFLVHECTRLQAKPNTDGDFIVAVCMQPSHRLLTTLLSIWKAGAAYLPIDPKFPQSRIQHILAEAKPMLVIHDDDINSTQFEAASHLSISAVESQAYSFCDTNLLPEQMFALGQTNLSVVLYTSGSTGVPKGVRLPHAVILNRLHWQWITFPFAKDEQVCVFKTALTFVDSIAEIWGPLLRGLAILVVPKHVTQDPELLVELLEYYKIKRLVLVPTLLRSLLLFLNMNKKQNLLSNLHNWVCSGESLPLKLVENFYEYFEEGVHALYNFYGSTEVMGDVTYFKCDTKQLHAYERVPIGTPISNTVIYLLDGDYRPVKNGEIGEIFASGMNLAHGYVNGRDPERFLENPLAIELEYSRLYRTGDYGSLLNGNIMYEGRTDSQIKVRGHRVDLAEVEKHVTELPVVDKAIVLCYHSGQIDQSVLAFVKLRDDVPLYTELQLESMLKDKLADYMIPQVVLIEHVPLLVNGKIDRQALLKGYETANNNEGDDSIILDFDYTNVPKALQAAAQDLFETVGSVIGRSTRATLSLHSNFYELGGNSLNSIFTVSLLREKNYNISISEFIGAQNLGEILEKITRSQDNDAPQDEWITTCSRLDMEMVPLQLHHKNVVIQIIVDSFYGKADLEQWLKPDIKPTDYSDIINDIWESLVEKDLSFVVRDKNSDKIIGAALNFDARDEPEIEIRSKLQLVFEFLEFLEGPIRENYLPQGLNKIFHSNMMGTSGELDARENIGCIHFMEREILHLAKKKSFAGIMTTNTSPLTQQLGNTVFGYKTLLDFQVNEYAREDGYRPFGQAPDSQRAIVHWKEV